MNANTVTCRRGRPRTIGWWGRTTSPHTSMVINSGPPNQSQPINANAAATGRRRPDGFGRPTHAWHRQHQEAARFERERPRRHPRSSPSGRNGGMVRTAPAVLDPATERPTRGSTSPRTSDSMLRRQYHRPDVRRGHLSGKKRMVPVALQQNTTGFCRIELERLSVRITTPARRSTSSRSTICAPAAASTPAQISRSRAAAASATDTAQCALRVRKQLLG